MGPNKEAHARSRKTLVHNFSDKSLKEQARILEGHVQQLVEILREIPGGTPFNLVDWLNFTTFEIAGDLWFGESFDCLKNCTAHPWAEISYTFGKGLALIAAINYYHPLNKILRLVIPKQIMQRTTDHIAMSRAKVMKRLSSDTNRPDFVAHILNQNKQNEAKAERKAMTPPEINMTVLIFAGSETTASGLSGIMRMLLQNRYPLMKLGRETPLYLRVLVTNADDLSAFQSFQLGRHSCIGQSLAYAEMRLVLARLIYAFDVRLADATDIWDRGKQKTFIFWGKEPLKVVVERVNM